MMFVMLCHFGSGHTGIRLETLALIRDMLNAGISPIVPGHGSVGYLTLEGHIGMVMIGEGRAAYQGETLDGAEALKRAGLKPVVLSSKEGLILLSGTTSVTAFASLAIYDAQTLSLTADIAGSFTLEVLKGTLMAMDERLMTVRPHPDQINTAANIRAILKNSPMLERYRGHRVQDALSIRCMPQLHDPVKKAVKDAQATLAIELNSSVDNPLIFDEEDGGAVALMGCNADGTYAGMASDNLCIAITDLCKMSNSRIDRLLNSLVSELPAFLNKNADFNNGLMMIQYASAGLQGELRILAHPAVVDNLTTCANQEDYVNMGYNAAKKAYDSMHLAKYILAAELICDGHHVNPISAGIVMHAKGHEHVALITDCMCAGGMPDGDYFLGELPVVVAGGTARLKDGGSLAGSILNMKDAVKNVYEWGIATKAEAVYMATQAPAEANDIADECGSIRPGRNADFVVLNPDLSLVETYLGGESVYTA